MITAMTTFAVLLVLALYAALAGLAVYARHDHFSTRAYPVGHPRY